MEKPLILVCNDDGVTAKGIRALTDVARQYARVVVVAPDKPQSGMGHAITINDALRVQEITKEDDLEIYSTSGTPADCIKLAINEIVDRRPDLIVSGINHGSNASVNVMYSGTMSAAIEGCLEGIPSIGFSLLDFSADADFEASQKFAGPIIEHVLNNGLPPRTCLNVNIPKGSPESITESVVCRQAIANWEEKFDKREDPYGRNYYWLTGTFVNYDPGNDTDIAALESNKVSIVPVHIDLTSHEAISALDRLNLHV